MTIDSHDQRPEQEIEQDLEKVRSAWTRQERTEPPELLDRAVLNSARREIEAQGKRRPLRWLGAFATATVVVLALSIVIQQDQEAPAPALKEGDGFRLDRADPAASNEEIDQDDARRGAGQEQQGRQLIRENDGRLESRMKKADMPSETAASAKREPVDKPLAPAPEVVLEEFATPQSSAAVAATAGEMTDFSDELEKGADTIAEAEAWIERLLLLQETQQDEKLAQELAAFRAAYPDYPLPPDLVKD